MSLETFMRIISVLLLLASISIYAQDVTVPDTSSTVENRVEDQVNTSDNNNEITDSKICQDFLIKITTYEQGQIDSIAKFCNTHYLNELKSALEQIHNEQKTTCDYTELKEEVSLFNEIIDLYVKFEAEDKESLEKMRELFQIMYTSDVLIDCSLNSQSEQIK